MRIGVSFEEYIKEITASEKESLSNTLSRAMNCGDEVYIITKQSSIDNSNTAKKRKLRITRQLQKNGIKYDCIVYGGNDNSSDIWERNEIDVLLSKDAVLQLTLAEGKTQTPTSNANVNAKLDEIRDVLNRKTKKNTLSGNPSMDRIWEQYYTAKEKTHSTPEMSMYQYIYMKNVDHLDGIALKYQGSKITYRDFFKRIDDCAKALIKNNISKGNVATVAMPNTPETIALFYALNKLGVIAHMLDPRLPAEEIKSRINKMKADILFFLDADPITTALSEFDFIEETTLKKAVSISPKISMPFMLKTLYTLLMERKNTHIPESGSVTNWNSFILAGAEYKDRVPCVYEPNKPAVIIHTGGTTGKSKGAVHCSEAFNGLVSKYRGTRRNIRQTEVLTMAPLFHILGAAGIHCVGLSDGLILDLMPKFTPNAMIKTLKKGKTNCILCVTAILTFLQSNPKIRKLNLSSLDFIISGGENIAPELETSFNEFLKEVGSNAKLSKGYGLTEGAMTVFSKGEADTLGAIGIPLVNTDIKFVNPETGKEVGYYEKGEICLYAFNMLEYYDESEETGLALRIHDDGKKWLHTGDIGHIREDGVVCFDDRIKQLIITNGQKAYPAEIERIIKEHPSIQECAVVGFPDEKRGQVPKAHVILKEGAMPSAALFEDITAMCKKKLPPYSIPCSYRVRAELPKTLMNKIDKKVLEAEDMEASKSLNDDPGLYVVKRK